MNYLSVCSGIEAASVAWHPLGWRPFAFAEIEKFPSAVLAHHYPHVPNLGDMTKHKDWPDADLSVLVGGTPCQSFSVAGLRKGLADPRGNLALVYLAIADQYRPEWLVWENVPGVLSSNGGRDFGAFIGGLEQLGYHASWRVLDAQYVRVDGLGRAVPQRRRRVFVVGHLGDWRRAAAVLFERESLQGDSPPRRQAREGIAAYSPSSIGGYSESEGNAGTLRTHGGDYGGGTETIVARCVTAGYGSRMDYETETMIAHALRADGFDASEDGTGRGTPLVPVHGSMIAADIEWQLEQVRKAKEKGIIAFDTTQITSKTNRNNPQPGDACHPLAAGAHAPAIAGVTIHGTDKTARTASYTDVAGALRARTPGSQENSSTTAVQQGWAVRRLTPRECERLQGFPDDYTLVPYRGKDAADGPRYKALGNSMAVNCMRWIGNRIEQTTLMANDSA